jgi:type IV fimbrial biogenesis protein FimT
MRAQREPGHALWPLVIQEPPLIRRAWHPRKWFALMQNTVMPSGRGLSMQMDTHMGNAVAGSGKPPALRLRDAARGFTLIELMVTIAILVVLITVAAPSMREFLLNSRRAALSNDLLFSLQLARSEAIKLGHKVAVCASSSGSGCSTAASDWSKGWIVELRRSTPSGEVKEMLYKGRIPAAGQTVQTSRAEVVFRPFSTALEGSLGATFTVCDLRGGTHARAVVVSASGRSRVAEPNETTLSCTT